MDTLSRTATGPTLPLPLSSTRPESRPLSSSDSRPLQVPEEAQTLRVTSMDSRFASTPTKETMVNSPVGVIISAIR